MQQASEPSFKFKGRLAGHRNWITALTCPPSDAGVRVVSASRDKTLVAWTEKNKYQDDGECGIPHRRLEGHSDFVSDVALSLDGGYALSSSWDGSVRLWNLLTGRCLTQFRGHTKDVTTVAFSSCNTLVASGGRDNQIYISDVEGKLFRTLGKPSAHNDWVSCVRFVPTSDEKIRLVSAGWDNLLKLWDVKKGELIKVMKDHEGYINHITVSPDGSICASGGKDMIIRIWELEVGEIVAKITADSEILCLAFSPTDYWICAATEKSVKIYDLQTQQAVIDVVAEPNNTKNPPKCLSVAWSADGEELYAGYTDGIIRVWSQ